MTGMISPRQAVAGSVIAGMLSASAGAFAQAPPAPPPAPVAPAPYPYPAPAPYPYPPPAAYPVPYQAPYYYPPPAPRYITDWEPGRPIPPGYRQEMRARKGLVIAGSITFGAIYIYTALIGEVENNNSISGQDSNGWLWIPVLGPFLEAADTGSDIPASVLILDGIGQAGGLAMLIAGLAMPRPILVRNDLFSMTPVPMTLGKGASGFGLVGRF